MRLFVTGLAGYLGHALAAAAPGEVAGTVWRQPGPRRAHAFRVDVRDERAVAAALAAARPDVVVHTAYVQTGDDMESVNVDGAAAVARAARPAGLRLVHMSSDVIFAGDLGRPVREEDAAVPITAYGRSKLAAEHAVAAAHPGALMVRTSLIYGGEEPSKHELAALDPANAFYEDEIRCPVAVGDLAAAVLELAAASELSGPLHVAGPDAVSRLEFARLIVAVHGGDPAGVRAARRPADRPGDVRLDCTRARGLLRTRLRGPAEVLARR